MHGDDDKLAIARSKLAELRQDIAIIQLRLAIRAFGPDHPRWPAGGSDGGRWRPAGGAGAHEAAYNPTNESRCNMQMRLDEELCRTVRSRECWSMVMERWDACMRDAHIPALRVGL